ncbi:MAG TPA: Fic family protein [Chitinophagaceae bacterium]|nr:Fic family protein [Chitinophagaceae bacterium]
MGLSLRKKQILEILLEFPGISTSQILKRVPSPTSIPTLNRDLKALVGEHFLIKSGNGRATIYQVVPGYHLIHRPIGDSYFEKDIEERKGNQRFNQDLFSLLETIDIFTPEEYALLEELQKGFKDRLLTLPGEIRRKEQTRLTVELSWKSSQIEGNTYSLLETEVLLEDHVAAEGKEKSEATMLINHKRAMDYIYEHRIPFTPLKVEAIENIHSLLINELGVAKNIRKRIVGITGTSYTPPDNEFQIREYLDRACTMINRKKPILEKALLAILSISYIQPFEDGNKRTGRIAGNGILIENGYCPLSYRSVKPIDYKKAMVLFYEQNSLVLFKKLFMDQYEFAVKNYFR